MPAIMRKFGSVYIDETPCEPGTQLSECVGLQSIKIGDSDIKMIPWVVVDNILVAQRDVLIDVSWETLEANGLIDGKDIFVDRLPYRIRLLRKGKDVENLGEFQRYIDTLDEPGAVGKSGRRIWLGCTEDQIDFNSVVKPIVFCRKVSERKFQYDVRGVTSGVSKDTAWLPVLEPVRASLDKSVENEYVAIWTTTGEFVSGQIVEISEYDLLLASGFCIAADGTNNSPWVREFGFCLAVDRKGIWSLQLYEKGETI